MTTRTEAIDDFVARLPFQPDGFQTEAFGVIADGESVIVAAPTSAGKTLVAEAAVAAAVATNRRAFYTTPIKALSNQKFTDFAGQYGEVFDLVREYVNYLSSDKQEGVLGGNAARFYGLPDS